MEKAVEAVLSGRCSGCRASELYKIPRYRIIHAKAHSLYYLHTITMQHTPSAAGYAIPPMVIFDRKRLNPQLTIGEVPGTHYGLTDNRWMTARLFHEWFCHHYLRYAPSCRPLLLLLHGHSLHYQPAVVEIAAAEGVIIFCLPPHTSHISQPLDNVAFAA